MISRTALGVSLQQPLAAATAAIQVAAEKVAVLTISAIRAAARRTSSTTSAIGYATTAAAGTTQSAATKPVVEVNTRSAEPARPPQGPATPTLASKVSVVVPPPAQATITAPVPVLAATASALWSWR